MVWMEAMVHLSLARGQTARIHPRNTTSHWTLGKNILNNPSIVRDVDTWHFSVNNERELKNTEAQRMLIFRNDDFNFELNYNCLSVFEFSTCVNMFPSTRRLWK